MATSEAGTLRLSEGDEVAAEGEEGNIGEALTSQCAEEEPGG